MYHDVIRIADADKLIDCAQVQVSFTENLYNSVQLHNLIANFTKI